MPELPEVETVRRGLAGLVSGMTVSAVDVRRDSCVRLQGGGASAFADEVVGAVMAGPARRGKFLWFPLEGADGVVRGALSAHLGMSGQFRVFAADDAPEPHPHCRARFALAGTGGPLTLDFLDQRTFGYLVAEPLVAAPDGGAGGYGSDLAFLPRSVVHIARDALDPLVNDPQAITALRRGSRGIKQVLLDQTVVSGIGNIYADEALWLARLHPRRQASTLSQRHAETLLAAVREVMERALAQGGTSFDALYVNVNGESGYFARSLNAYGKAGSACERCGTLVSRATVHGRSTHWCARCQRMPRTGTARD